MTDFESDLELLLFVTSDAVQAALQDWPPYEHPFWLAQGTYPHAVVEAVHVEQQRVVPNIPLPLSSRDFLQQRDRGPHHNLAFSPASSFPSYSPSPVGSVSAFQPHTAYGYQRPSPPPPQLSMSAEFPLTTPSTITQATYGIQPPQSSAELAPVNDGPYDATYPQDSEVPPALSWCSSSSVKFSSQLDRYPRQLENAPWSNHAYMAASPAHSTSSYSPSSEEGNGHLYQHHIPQEPKQQPVAPRYIDHFAVNPFNDLQSASGNFERHTRLPNQLESQNMFDGGHEMPSPAAPTAARAQGPQFQHFEYPSEDPNRRTVAKLPARQPSHKNGQSTYGTGMDTFEGHNVPIRHPLSSADVPSGHLAHFPVDNRSSGHGRHIVSTHEVAAQGPVYAPPPPVATHAASPLHQSSSASLSRETERPIQLKSVRPPQTGGSTSSGGNLIERNQPNKISGSGREVLTMVRAQQENGQATGRAFAAQPGPQSFSNAKSSRQFKARDPFRACKRPWERMWQFKAPVRVPADVRFRIFGWAAGFEVAAQQKSAHRRLIIVPCSFADDSGNSIGHNVVVVKLLQIQQAC
ncbi:hypothetical protein CVT26_004332 [Gymnopilus dilepis]|uniref:Uncharacterized protein n=1 Tax=Gymnopilus dilepis TaxID=231916 RepID=A0A409YMN2_9AGAR|nr:hypothetical protein CVT26_004332 [Gymnopilus dilepis]